MKILLPVDGSPTSARAVLRFIALAADLAVPPETHLLHVHPPLPIGGVQRYLDRGALDAHYRSEGEAELAGAAAQLEAAGIAFQRHLHVGDPAEVIAKVADELGCTLIVMGTHGRGRVATALLGSVAGQTLRLADCPVLLAR
jgi:nucleotide-binding universal stress UspA family protein